MRASYVPPVALIGFLLSASVAFAWTGPTQTAPAGNVSAPINVGTTDQVKSASLGVNGLAVFGNSLLQAASYLNWGATAGSGGYGIRDNGGTLEFKNSAGSWSSLSTIVTNIASTGASQWTTSGSNIYYNTGNVGIGAAVPASKLTVSGNASSLPTPSSGTVLHIANANGTQTRLLIDTFGASGGSNLSLRTSNGTAAAPTALVTDDFVGNVAFFGYGSTGYSASSRAAVQAKAAEAWTDAAQGTYMRFLTTPIGSVTSAESMRIDPSGNVGIGNTTPSAKLTVGSAGSAANSYYDIGASKIGAGTSIYSYGKICAGNNSGDCSGAGGVVLASVGTITAAGNVTAAGYFHSSDRRLKENIRTSRGIDFISKLRGVTFNWKKDGAPASGLIAQEVERVLPSAVKIDSQGMKSVEYDQLIAPLIEAVKEQQAEIDFLKHEITILKGSQ